MGADPWCGDRGRGRVPGAFFAAVDRAGVALGTLVAIGSGPVFTGLVALAASGERPVPRWYPATGPGRRRLRPPAGPPAGTASWTRVGLGLALGAGLSYAVYTVAAKAVLDRGVPGPTVMATFFLGGAVLLLPALLVADTDGLLSGRGIAMELWLGVATTAVAYVLFSAGLRRLRSLHGGHPEPHRAPDGRAARRGGPGRAPRPLALLGAVVLLSGLLVISTGRSSAPEPVPEP